jgi:hypothetical protein
MHRLCRNDLKRGKGYSRLFIRPMDMALVLSLPWLIFNVLDSIIFFLNHTGFCEKCQCKYRPQHMIVGHEKNDCEYNCEYQAVVLDIMNGRIMMTEEEHHKKAIEKIDAGHRSAYYDLCSHKSGFWSFWDVTTIWLTICLYIYLFVRLTLPPVLYFFKHADFSG